MSGLKAGAGEGNASTRSAIRSQSSPRTQSSSKVSSVLGTSKEHVHDGDAGRIYHTPKPFMQHMKDTKRKAGGEPWRGIHKQ
jgi:hypothetical protein